MRKPMFLAALAAALVPSAAIAQMAGSAPSNPYANLAGSGMEAHDTATQPSQRDMMINALTNDAVDKIQQHQRDKLGRARPAKRAEITAGAVVNDKDGIAIAKVEQVDVDGVIVSSGTAKVKVPAEAFGLNKAGLLLDMSQKQFQQIVAQATTHP